MLVTAYSAFSDYWELRAKVTFDGVRKIIYVNPHVNIQLDIREDVWTEWVQWSSIDNNSRYLVAMRYSGLDPIPGGRTGGVFFLTNGWKLYYDPRVVAVSGVMYSDDYDTAYFDYNDKPMYPTQVSALVNTSTTVQNIVTGDVSAVPAAVWAQNNKTIDNINNIDNITALTEQIPNAVWTHNNRSLTDIANIIAAFEELSPETAQSVLSLLEASIIPVDAVKIGGNTMVGVGTKEDKIRSINYVP